MITKGLLQAFDLLRLQLPISRRLNKFGNIISPAGAIKPQRRRQMRIIGILNPLLPGDLPPRLSNPAGGIFNRVTVLCR